MLIKFTNAMIHEEDFVVEKLKLSAKQRYLSFALIIYLKVDEKKIFFLITDFDFFL